MNFPKKDKNFILFLLRFFNYIENTAIYMFAMIFPMTLAIRKLLFKRNLFSRDKTALTDFLKSRMKC